MENNLLGGCNNAVSSKEVWSKLIWSLLLIQQTTLLCFAVLCFVMLYYLLYAKRLSRRMIRCNINSIPWLTETCLNSEYFTVNCWSGPPIFFDLIHILIQILLIFKKIGGILARMPCFWLCKSKKSGVKHHNKFCRMETKGQQWVFASLYKITSRDLTPVKE